MILEAVVLGGVTGFVSAFFGIGGSSIDTPLLREYFNFSPNLALGTPLPTTLATVFVAMLTYWKKHLVNYRVFVYSLVGGMPGIIFGSYLSQFFSGLFLMALTSMVLFAVGLYFVSGSLDREGGRGKSKQTSKKRLLPAVYIIIVAGFVCMVSGILANGGGLFLIPTYVLVFGLRMREAIATSLLSVAVMAIPASIIHFNLGHIDLETSAAMGLGAIPMAYLGAKMDLKTKPVTIQLLFGFFAIIFSVYFFLSQTGMI